MEDTASEEAKALRQKLYHLTNQNELLKAERDGLEEALRGRRSKPSKGKPLPLLQRKETRSAAQWWSPRGVNEAQHLQDIFDKEQEDAELVKATKRELRQSNTLLKKKLAAEKREAAATKRREAAERAELKRQEVAERKATREAQKRNNSTKKSSQLPNQGKRKASSQSQANPSKKRCSAAARSGVVAYGRSPIPPPKYNSRGRRIAPPKKLHRQKVLQVSFQ